MKTDFRRWSERLAAADHTLPTRIRYVRKSSESDERQVASHEQQVEAMDKKWGPVPQHWHWRDSASGTSFDRPAFQDMLDFCRRNKLGKSVGARIEIYDPSRFSRALAEDGTPDIPAFQNVFNELESLGWPVHFVTPERTGNVLTDTVMMAVHSYTSSAFSQKLSQNVRRGVQAHARAGWWTHGGAPWGTKRLDTRTNRVLEKGELGSPGGGGIILTPDSAALAVWNRAAKRLVAGASLDEIGRGLFAEGILGPRGGRLGHSSIRKLLTNRALIGRTHLLEGESGQRARVEVAAKWGPMVDIDLFELVSKRLRGRTPADGGRHRRRRELYPLTPVCAHCGLEYNGGRNKAEQGSKRCYTHANPKERAHPDAFERMHTANCRVWSIDAEELEDKTKELIVRERASEEFATYVRQVLLDRDERRKDAQRRANDARATVAACEQKSRALARTVSRLAEEGLEVSEDDALFRELTAAKRKELAAKLDLTEAERFVASVEDAWAKLATIINETKNIAQVWDRCSAEDRAAILDYWVLDLLVAVEPVPGKRRANIKTAVVTLRTSPHVPQDFEIPSGARLIAPRADSISARTTSSDSTANRSRRAAAPASEPIRPIAQAAWPRTRDSSSPKAMIRAGRSAIEPVLPNTTAELRRSPDSLARFMAEPRNNSVYSGTPIPNTRSANSREETPSRKERGRKGESSASSLENLRLYGHTSLQMSQPYSSPPTPSRSAGGIGPRCSMVR
jgi:DNA invertase Pin-like site-specific DNA recombinase